MKSLIENIIISLVVSIFIGANIVIMIEQWKEQKQNIQAIKQKQMNFYFKS